MTNLDPEQAQGALQVAAAARRRVADELGLPRAYWWVMGLGWLGLGFISHYASPWVTVLATIAFGAAHASVASRWLDGRHRTGQIAVARSVAGGRVAATVIGLLLGAILVTVVLALGLDADGARHAGIWASGVVGIGLALGGPGLLAAMLTRTRR
ncbi:hypothetical protein [Branchiibius sp. NY16-3462-2]|uniref:hypothetical protein n=1 Tax=Branchiibius sp. NY16-3462-2 TaxID=1807500 RepID=UPI000794A55F|nr:hypothetical protein [Branchiibius sp. NY16-3462-2]KYH43830.1 hypothetical protein AZH51_03290 [Branchiibius sp. NY16-3462-2]